MTQVELARELKVTFAALNRWLNGHSVPRASMVNEITKLYRELVGYPSITKRQIAQVLHQANELKIQGLWDLFHKEPLQEELLLEHTYNSTTIEGTTFTKKETEAVIFDHSIIQNKPLREHLEVTNHAVLLRDILNKKYSEPVSEKLIKEFHKILMQGIREDAGNYATHPRGIRGVNIALPHPEDIQEEMRNLMTAWRHSKLSRFERIADFYIRFELIHPFGDGNGRVGRLIMIYQCLQEDFPPVIIETARKAEYYDVLEYAQRKSPFPFLVFLFQEMAKTHQLIQKYR